MPTTGSLGSPVFAFYAGNPTNVAMSVLNIQKGTLVIDTSTPALWQKTSTTDNSAFALVAVGSSGGTLTAPVISGGLTASGSVANDFSGSTGAFNTSTGTTTIGGGLVDSTQSLSGAGAVNLTTVTTKLTTTGAAQALTLSDGINGQVKKIIHEVDGGSAVLTPTTKTGFSTITFTNVGDSATLEFITTRGWMILSLNGAVSA